MAEKLEKAEQRKVRGSYSEQEGKKLSGGLVKMLYDGFGFSRNYFNGCGF